MQTEMALSIKGHDKVFNDPIHGSIRLHPLLVKIIDTPQFQRLRYIKQLGGCYFVYPGASHNRFEHSLGVAHLAGKLIEKIKREQGILNITEEDILCVKIAGLCHDLGHGPFSHLWDKRFLKKFDTESAKEWKHEKGSVMMLDYLIESNADLKSYFEEFNMKEDHIQLIKELINPTWPYSEKMKTKSFLYEIVANKRNEVDVDKWDYFARDCHNLGIPCGFGIDRAMEFVRVASGEDGLQQICFRDKEVANMYQLFQTRLTLHRTVYQHKTSNAVECMLTEALFLADPFLEIYGEEKKEGSETKKMSECIQDIKFFMSLTDGVIQHILDSPDSGLDESRKLLIRIQKRDLYKLIGQFTCSEKKDELLEKEIEKFIETTKENLEIDKVNFNFGKKEANPIDHICFYRKNEDHATPILSKFVSKMLPTNDFEEIIYRVYSKSSDQKKIEENKIIFKEWCDKNKDKVKVDESSHPMDGPYFTMPLKSDPSLSDTPPAGSSSQTD